MASLPLIVATVKKSAAFSPESKSTPTSIKMSLLGKFVIRITVRVNGTIELFERHESMDKLIIGMKQSSKPLLFLNMMDLYMISSRIFSQF
jgi:hypothetical protein